ncbi:hypothetical protein ACFQE0_13750 [Methylobacterium komagatae]|uniref:DNA transfer protein p32 n=1 Tax=Methylobacterium komagatae TaxID=374425 RepID=A0ABW2BJI3_9HYPH
MSSIFSGKPQRQAAIFAAQQLQQGKDQGDAALDQGYSRASDAYGQAATTFGNLANSYGAGSQLYQDALGVNGQAAADAAKNSYQQSAGYGFNLDQGLQALNRTRAVNGTLASGNADTDAMKFASGLASQDYGNWLSNLSGLDTKRYGATTGQAGTFGALGNAALQTGTAKAGLASSTANGIAQAGAAGLQAGQQAQMNGLNAIFSGVKSIGDLAGGIGKAFSIFG